MSKAIDIDGSYLEGGGQILRNALAFSCILRRPVRVFNIRANRPNPGISNQHLYGLNLLMEITGATVRGNAMKSSEVEFYPGDIKSGTYTVDTHTAASLALVLQSALPVMMFGPRTSELHMVGGTNVGMAPQVDFLTEVFRPNLELFGATFDFDLLRRGYYPRGGGRCTVKVAAVNALRAVDITCFGRPEELFGWCFVAGKLHSDLAETMRLAVLEELQDFAPLLPMNVQAYKESAEMARDNGSGVILKAVTSKGCVIGTSTLGERRIDAHALGKQAAVELSDYLKHNTCVDRHVQDQLILFMALAKGTSRVSTSCPLTNHTRTAIHVAELMTGTQFIIDESNKEHVIITCQGIGYQNRYI